MIHQEIFGKLSLIIKGDKRTRGQLWYRKHQRQLLYTENTRDSYDTEKKKSETVTAHRKHQKQLLYTKNISNSYWSQKTSVTVIVPRKPQRQLFVHRKLQ